MDVGEGARGGRVLVRGEGGESWGESDRGRAGRCQGLCEKVAEVVEGAVEGWCYELRWWWVGECGERVAERG